MKKILTYIAILTAGLLAAVSCDKNLPPVFDDANAFVGFDRPSLTVEEAVVKPNGTIMPYTATQTFKVPVTLGSVKGISETVKFDIVETGEGGDFLYHELIDKKGDPDDKANWKDQTAHQGKNFNLKTVSKTLTFDAEHRTQYIEFDILYYPEYTGDLKFDIVLSKPASVGLGYNSTCTVTVADVNHPLTEMLGDYQATSDKDGKTWVFTVKKDAKDDHMVWFDNIFANPGWAGDDTMFYGNVDDDKTTIIIPLGQTSEYVYSNGNPVMLLGLTAEGEGYDSGNITVTIVRDEETGKILGLDFGEEYGVWAYIEDAGSVGYAYPKITAVKL